MALPDEPEGFTEEERALFAQLNIGTEGGMPLPSFIKPSEVVEQARPMAESIFRDWAVLKRLVEQHEARLLEKWKSTKRKRRREILLETWGPIPEQHRPDLSAWRIHEESGDTLWAEKDRDAFMWPHVNLDDLSKTRNLWLMMKTRGRNAPDTFAAADLDTTRFGKTCLALMPRYLNKYSMLFAGRTTPESYGQLYAWDDLPSEDRTLFSNIGTHPGEGLWILTIQSRLYAFLKDAAVKILGVASSDSAEESGSGGSTLAQPELDDSFGQPESDFAELPVAVSEMPYTRPPALELQNLLDYTYGKVWEAEDHIWALREDAGYFMSALTNWRNHEWETTLDGPEKESGAVWAKVVNACVKGAIADVEAWNILYAKVRLVAQQMEKCAGTLRPESPLPRELALSLYSLHQHLRNFENDPIEKLETGAFASPPLRPYFRAVRADTEDSAPLWERSPEVPDDTTADMIWALSKLKDVQQRQVVGAVSLLDSLDRTLQCSPATRNALSPWVASRLSASALFATCLAELDHFQPWAATFSSATQDKETADVLGLDWHMTMQRLRPLLEHTLRPSVVARALLPDDGRPLGSGGGGSDGAEANAAALDAFWAKLHSSLERHKALTPRLREILEKTPVRRGGAAGGAGGAKGGARKVTVDKRALKVFRALFYDAGPAAGKSNTPAETTWLDIVRAMKAAGFSATRLYGAGWLFVPRPSSGAAGRGQGAGKNGAAATMQPSLFEEPWGVAKIPPESARWIGKRLARAYGWTLESFEAE